MTACEKCGNREGLPTTLTGGVRTILCPACATDWHEMIRDHESLRRLNYANAVMSNVVQRGALLMVEVVDPVFNQACSVYAEHSGVLFDLALEWLDRPAPGPQGEVNSTW